MSTPHPPVTPREIAELTSWARSLTRPEAPRDPDEVASFQTAKAALLARIATETDAETTTTEQDHSP